MTWEQAVTLISVLGGICGIVFGIRNVRRTSNEDIRAEAMQQARVEAKLDTAVRGIEDLRTEFRQYVIKVDDLAARVLTIENKIKEYNKN